MEGVDCKFALTARLPVKLSMTQYRLKINTHFTIKNSSFTDNYPVYTRLPISQFAAWAYF